MVVVSYVQIHWTMVRDSVGFKLLGNGPLLSLQSGCGEIYFSLPRLTLRTTLN